MWPQEIESKKARAVVEPKIELTPARIKKGICGQGGKCKLTGAGWYHNWMSSPGRGEIDAEFVPMIKGHVNATDKTFAKIEKLKKSHAVTHLLGFNEPDRKKQGNTSVQQAIAAWPKLMETGLRLGSPSVADDQNGLIWLNRFLAEAAKRRFRIDFLAVHKYPNIRQRNSLRDFFLSLDQLHRKYRLPIWITEFGGLNFGSKDRHMTRDDNFGFMRQVVPLLEQLAYVERYAWFSSGPKDIACLYDPAQPNGLSPLGNLYRSIGGKEQAK